MARSEKIMSSASIADPLLSAMGEEMVEPDGIEPTTSSMPLLKLAFSRA
jgi:hypothetical protein